MLSSARPGDVRPMRLRQHIGHSALHRVEASRWSWRMSLSRYMAPPSGICTQRCWSTDGDRLVGFQADLGGLDPRDAVAGACRTPDTQRGKAKLLVVDVADATADTAGRSPYLIEAD